jgi:hypothetical protein
MEVGRGIGGSAGSGIDGGGKLGGGDRLNIPRLELYKFQYKKEYNKS